MKKLKLEDKISTWYISLFLIFIIFSNVSIFYILKTQNDKERLETNIAKTNEINDFLNKVTIFSQKYNNFSLEFNPKIEGKKVTYSKPFNPGEEGYLYLLTYTNSNSENKILLNTVITIDSDEKESDEELLNDLQKLKLEANNLKKSKIIGLNLNSDNIKRKYSVIKIEREIAKSKFEVYVLRDITSENTLFYRLMIVSGIVILVGLLIIYITSKYLSKRVLKPINAIINSARIINAKNLSERIPDSKSGDELERLSKILNQMLNRLETSFYNQSKFVSDASHELRTPLTIIKGYAAIIKKRKLTNPEIFEESIDSIINEVDNMLNLIEKLLFLARGERNKINSAFKEVRINDMIEQIYTEAKISNKKHNYKIVKNDECILNIDETLLKQAIRTILENSMKYSEEGSTIYISSEIVKKEVIITIRDEGIGISEEDQERVFERFYRIDESRTKSTGGTGLGLAIVSRIIEIHSGRINVKSQLNVGTEIQLILPV